MNYIGNKYRILDQIKVYFPDNINNFVDLFYGGLDVTINIETKNKFANDINCFLINIYKSFQKYSMEEILNYIDNKIQI